MAGQVYCNLIVNFKSAHSKKSTLPEDTGFEVFVDLSTDGGHDAADLGRSPGVAEVVRRVHLGRVFTEIILVRLLEPIDRKLVEESFEVSCVVGDVEILRDSTRESVGHSRREGIG